MNQKIEIPGGCQVMSKGGSSECFDEYHRRENKFQVRSAILYLLVFLVFITILLLANDARATDIASDITENTIWSQDGNPWVIRNDIAVRNNVELFISSGTVVQFGKTQYNQKTRIRTEGTGRIFANGVSGARILFTSLPGNPTRQYWDAISTGAEGVFRNCTLEYGTNGLYAGSGSDISDCIFNDSLVGIHVIADNVTITNCTANRCDFGFYLSYTADTLINNTYINGCVANNCTEGYSLEMASINCWLNDCRAYDISRYAIKIMVYGGNIHIENIGINNVRTGIIIQNSGMDRSPDEITIHNVSVNNASEHGVGILDCYTQHGIDITRMMLTRCDVGLFLSSSDNITFTDNIIRENANGAETEDCQSINTWIWGNDFLDNSVKPQAHATNCSVNWSKDGRGNYWSDYHGMDANGDNIGDTSYQIPAGLRDEYPLMIPVDFEDPIADAGPDITIPQHELFILDGSGSHDDCWIVNWTWSIGSPAVGTTIYGKTPRLILPYAGVHLVTLIVRDVVGRTARDDCVVNVTDVELPVFVDISIAARAGTGETLVLDCNVTDNVMVQFIGISYGTGTIAEDTLYFQKISDEHWQAAFTIPEAQREDIVYHLFAQDTSGNSNSTMTFKIEVFDALPPRITPLLPENGLTGNSLFVNCSIVENWEIYEVKAELWSIELQRTILTLSVSGSTWSAQMWIADNTRAALNVQFSASDSTGNVGVTPVLELAVLDDDPPTLVLDASELLTGRYHKGENVTFQILVEDNWDVEGVLLEIRYRDGTWAGHDMNLNGEFHKATVQLEPDRGNMIWFRYRMWDTSNNTHLTDETQVELLGLVPKITTRSPPTEVLEDHLYSFRFEAYDPDTGSEILQWHLSTNASWLTLEAQSHILRGIPGELYVGWYWVNLTVIDEDTSLDTILFNITVVDVNYPPRITIDSPVDRAKVEDRLRIAGTASDDGGQLAGIFIRIDGGEWLNLTGSASWSLIVDVKEFEPGLHRVEARSYDGVQYSEIQLVEFEVPVGKDDNESIGFDVIFTIISMAIISGLAILHRNEPS